MKKQGVHAVHERDLDDFLKSLGLIEALERGELKCDICGCRINRGNFKCIYPLKDEIKICCDKLECYQNALLKVKGAKLG